MKSNHKSQRIIFSITIALLLSACNSNVNEKATDTAAQEKYSLQELYNVILVRSKTPKKITDTIPGLDTLQRMDLDTLIRIYNAKKKSLYGNYGKDDRIDVCETKNSSYINNSEKVVAFFEKKELEKNPDGSYSLSKSRSLGESFSLCPTERFFNQPSNAFCSGFAVSKRVIVTAGHCIDESNKDNIYIVFGYKMKNSDECIQTFPAENVYEISRIVGRELNESNNNDYAVIEVNKDIPITKIADLRRNGKISNHQDVYVIGHPSGLPLKIAPSAIVRDNSIPGYFITNLDTYGGNSGSPVFNATTHLVEGILVRGGDDYIKAGACNTTVTCPFNGCGGEDVSRNTQFLRLIKF